MIRYRYQQLLDEMINQVFTEVFVSQDRKTLTFKNDRVEYVFSHIQDCCEEVWVESIFGDLSDLENSPLLLVRCDTSRNNPDLNSESYTWTFYNFATVKGYVTVRFLGESNGYYSEEVDIWKNYLLIS
jgi:hypothetical protein